MIPQQTIDQILQSADIANVISEYVKLTKSGANYKCSCPFHDEKSASLVVSPAKRIWKCFGCGKGGNVISFVQEHEAISFPEAVKIVANKYHITVPEKELSDDDKKLLQHRESLYIALQAAQEHFLSNIGKQTYLGTRGISAETLAKYGAGFAPKDFKLLLNTLTQKGYSVKTLTDAGLLNPKGDKIFDRFIDRITFPFYDLSGRIVGFTGRAIDNSLDDKVQNLAKYLNSPDTELFSKTRWRN